MSSFTITPEQIKQSRANRKAAGLAGCITGHPVPAMDFYGYKDVQSWRPADPMNPSCFCFDCRDLWDNDAAIDLMLLKNGNARANMAYSDIVPKRNNGGIPSLHVDTSMPAYGSFQEIPVPLLAPRHRDIINETKEQRFKSDLSELRGQIQSDLVLVMDQRRRGVFLTEPERSDYLQRTDEKEAALWNKLDAVEFLLKG